MIQRAVLTSDKSWQLTEKKRTRTTIFYDMSYAVGPGYCPTCNGPLFVKRRSTRTYKGVPQDDKTVWIRARLHTYECQGACRSCFMDAIPGMSLSHNITRVLENFIVARCPQESNLKIAKEVGLDEKTVRSIRREHNISPWRHK